MERLFLEEFCYNLKCYKNGVRGKAHGRIKFSSHYFINCIRFLAAFIDSVVGGGGLISLPALMFVGLPPASAIATNKLAATMGTFTSAIYFIRSGKVNFKIVGKLIPLTVIGAVAGALVVKFIPPDILRPLVLVMLVFIAIYIIAKRIGEVCLPIRR